VELREDGGEILSHVADGTSGSAGMGPESSGPERRP
jgi:hypothetical protein